MAGGMAAVLSIWLIAQMLLRERQVPGHPIHWAWLAPAGILVVHLGQGGLGGQRLPGQLSGGLNSSALLHLMLAAAAVMLAQCLLSRQVRQPVVICLVGLSMTVGAVLAVLAGTRVIGGAVTLVGLAGFWAVVSAAWPGEPALPRRHPPAAWFWAWRIGCLLAGAAGAAILARSFPREALLSVAASAVAALAAGLLRRGRRLTWLATAAVLGAAAALALVRLGPRDLWGIQLPSTWLGEGEKVFARLRFGDSGLSVLSGMIGWAGVGWLAAGVLFCLIRLWARPDADQLPADKVRSAAWTAAALTACVAVVMPGGLFVPGTVPAAGLTLGLLPAVLGCRPARRPGAILVVVVGSLLVLLGLASRSGLVAWSAASLGGGNPFLHGMSGFVVTLMLTWWLGARKAVWGVVGIALSVALGGAGELAQVWLSSRGGEWKDWGLHVLGCLPAAILYALCRHAALCELPDGRAHDLVTGAHRWTGPPVPPGRKS